MRIRVLGAHRTRGLGAHDQRRAELAGRDGGRGPRDGSLGRLAANGRDFAARALESELFRDAAPTTAAAAASVILDGVRQEKWRILIGHDAEVLDRLVREAPEGAYEAEFMQKLRAQTTWMLGD